MLSDYITQEHCRGVAREACPGTSHISIFRNEDDVHGNQDCAANAREPCAPDGFVDEFIPKRKVEIDSHHDFGSHDDGHDLQAVPVVRRNDVFQDVHVSHDHEESQQRENEEVFHRLGVGIAIVLFLLLSEDERLVGVAEGLRNHCHYHGDFCAGTVDAELHFALFSAQDTRQNHFVGSLVEDAGDAEHEDGPGVGQHPAQEARVKHVAKAGQFFAEEQRDERRAEEVDEKSIADSDGRIVEKCDEIVDFRHFVEPGKSHKEQQIERDVQHDEEQFERSKLDGFPAIAQEGKRNALKGINCHADSHRRNVFRMRSIVHELRNRVQKAHDGSNEGYADETDGQQRGRIDPHRLLFLLVHEAEESRFHSEGQQDK